MYKYIRKTFVTTPPLFCIKQIFTSKINTNRENQCTHDVVCFDLLCFLFKLTYVQPALVPWSSWFTHRLPEYVL